MKVLIFAISVFYLASDAAKITPNYDFPDEKVKILEIGSVLTLVCVVSERHEAPLRWYKQQNASSTPLLITSNHHYKLKHEALRIEKAVSSDAGVYFCEIPDETATKETFTVIANVKAVINEQYYFVDTETLNITCAVDGTDPVITWRVANFTITESTGKFVVERNLKKKYGRLLVKNVKTNDTNVYWCVVQNRATELLGIDRQVATKVHIWQQYVILWPYIGVCFEVAILCAGIWYYEQKCKKAEMEDDTEELEEDDEYDIGSNPISIATLKNHHKCQSINSRLLTKLVQQQQKYSLYYRDDEFQFRALQLHKQLQNNCLNNHSNHHIRKNVQFSCRCRSFVLTTNNNVLH
ncbi:uncharacterized protein LOC134829827 [Culicoides brevitarsis]|uniref:uncharacterized protein LOC134829827 n=1 Tax=Culicoides brevitarsis TaxID=469753 RepID=UPI00307C5898